MVNLQHDKEYIIEFQDPNYPCDCECHTNKNVMHIMPCCDDRSMTVKAKYQGVFMDQDFVPVLIYHIFVNQNGNICIQAPDINGPMFKIREAI